MDGAGAIVLDEMRIEPAVLRSIDKIIVVACGTAAYAGHVAKYAIEHWCRIPVEIELAHEFRYRDPIVSEKTLTVAIFPLLTVFTAFSIWVASRITSVSQMPAIWVFDKRNNLFK